MNPPPFLHNKEALSLTNNDMILEIAWKNLDIIPSVCLRNS